MKHSFFRMYFVSFLFFAFLFALGFFMKQSLGSFFTDVARYQTEIQALEPGLANQSTEALLSLDPLVGDFHGLVLRTFLVTLILFPFVVYFLFVLSESYLISQKSSWKYYGKAFVLGFPLLFLFYFTMNSFFTAFGNILTSRNALLLFLGYILLFSFLSYVWYTLTALLASNSLKKWKISYTKFFPLYFIFLLFFLLYLFLLFFLLYFVVSFITGSFFGNDLFFSFAFFLFLLVPLAFLRLWLVSFFKKGYNL